MKTNPQYLTKLSTDVAKLGFALAAALVCLMAEKSLAASATICSEGFESYTNVATALTDTSDADPDNILFNPADDNPIAPDPAGSGLQVINWLKHSGNQALLFRSGTSAGISFEAPQSGTNYQVDFWVYNVRPAAGVRNFRVDLQGEGSDDNGNDMVVYRGVWTAGSTAMEYYDGVGPGAGAWVNPGTINGVLNAWQHHRIVADAVNNTFDLYIDDMTTPVLTKADMARGFDPVATRIFFQHEGTTANDGYFVIDDLTVTVDGNLVNLNTTFTEGFESYSARTSATDDADPQGPWITTELEGSGAGTLRGPWKVQVVDATSGVTPHSGSKCVKLEGGQRGSVSVAWGVPPQADVQITWWARVPASLVGGEYNYLRMSLYGAEAGSRYAGDSALLGYGCRNATIGDATSLTYYTTAWVDSQLDFVPDTWEEYRLTTHNAQGRYTILKNPSSANPQVIADRKPMIGSAAQWGPSFMLAFSSSNGTNHPPVYVDDIQIKSLVSNPDPLPKPYNVQLEGSRFTNSTVLNVSGQAGKAVVDPRDNKTIVFTVDAATGGGIYKATKVASGNWAIDPNPVVANLANPSGITIGNDGTLYWVHDYTMALMRLKAPWESNTPETIIQDFSLPGATAWGLDDDPFDVCFPPADFSGSLASSTNLLVVDRGVDEDTQNAVFVVDPLTTELNQTNYNRYLAGPTANDLGGGNMEAITPVKGGKVATLSVDGQVTLIDGNGTLTPVWPDFYPPPEVPVSTVGLAGDPVTGRLWITENGTNQVWSFNPDGKGSTREVSFPLTNEERPDLKIIFAEPGLTFAKDGSIAIVTDASLANGGGRLIILHNEPIMTASIAITSYSKTAGGFTLNWQSAGGSAKYVVQRTTDLKVPMADISGDLTATTYTDATAPAGAAFYRVVVKP